MARSRQAALAEEKPDIPEPTPVTTEERLRAFEDAHGHHRHGGTVERGVGSKFLANIDDGWGQKHRDHHAALEALIAAENEHSLAEAASAAAHAKLEAAVKRAAETEEVL